ncbi:MAG: class I SAM-dependent methyltransferase [Planctomycetota bacterium]|jgi:ubiquinone/menaquinone biosynthesis C-methylase UbiE
MKTAGGLLLTLTVIGLFAHPLAGVYADSGESTRVIDAKQHECKTPGGYPYREKSDYVLEELDLKPGDVVVDVGAGDGFWAEKMAEAVGSEGVVHAGEVAQDKVDKMKKKLADSPQAKPYLCPTDGTGLEENTCDLAFFSKSYHHLEKDGRVDYLRHLRSVLKPTGRVVVIERYNELAAGRGKDHALSPGGLTLKAEEAGWILVRCENITGTYHFIAIFAQKDLFPVKPPAKKKPAKKPAAQKKPAAAERKD